MNLSLPQDVLDQIALEHAHFDAAPQALLKRCGFDGRSDLGGLDLERRKVIADLALNYSGW
ncbi:hypothetical protein D3C76_297790 [compost metagenome]